jgi:hypothetical protein
LATNNAVSFEATTLLKLLHRTLGSPTEHPVNQFHSNVLLHPSYIWATRATLDDRARELALLGSYHRPFLAGA